MQYPSIRYEIKSVDWKFTLKSHCNGLYDTNKSPVCVVHKLIQIKVEENLALADLQIDYKKKGT